MKNLSLQTNLLEKTLMDVRFRRAKQSIRYFAEEVLDICGFVNRYLDMMGDREVPRVKKLNWHQYEWFDMIEREKWICIAAPRDHWKSTIFSVVFPLWRILYGERGCLISNSQAQASDLLDRIKYFLENHPFFQYYGFKPERPRIWHKTALECSNKSTIITKSFGTPVRGGHYHWVVVDDPLSERMPYSMEYVKNYFKRAIVNMVIPQGRLILVGTPLRFDDLIMETLNNPNYAAKHYQAVLDWDEKKVLWPEYYSWDRLMERREKIGTLAFDQEFQCQPVDESSSLFPFSLVSNNFDPTGTLIPFYDPTYDCKVKGCNLSFYSEEEVRKHIKEFHREEPVEGVNYSKPLKTFIGCDLAISASTAADYTCYITLGLDEDGNRYILDIFREKGMSYREQIDKLRELNIRYRPKIILIESNQFQKVIFEMARETTDLPVREFVTGRKKSHLEEGVPGLRVLFENRKFKIPRGDQRSIEITNILVRELNAFGFMEGKVQGIGEHDDTVMALYIANEAIKQWEGKKLIFGAIDKR